MIRHSALIIAFAAIFASDFSADSAETTPVGLPEGQGLYLFVSSSIPEAGLVELAKDAAPLRIPVLLRGLVGESLQDTLVRMQSLTKVGAALEIDPLLFEAYKIERIPAVVRTCGARGEGPYAVVYGIAPSKALPVLRKMLSCRS